jgi:serine/threonine protein kinase
MLVNGVGQKLGKYEISERLGRGGMAEVYKAFQPGLDRYVAVKVLTGYFAGTPQFIARFKREARAIAQLRHPFIVQVFDFDMQDEWYYMVMEYLEGGTLHERIQQYGALPLTDVVRIGASLTDALDYAHQHQMIHRDIKPTNVMFADKGLAHPILTDFGIARIIGETALTTSGFMGTPAYISPEVARSEPVDERSDIYSMGVMLYEMVTGRLPFEGDTPFAVVMKHVHEQPPSLSQRAPGIPKSLEDVIYKALAKSRNERYQTAGELRDALLALNDMPNVPVANGKPQGSHATTQPFDSAFTPYIQSAPVPTPVLNVHNGGLTPEAVTEDAAPDTVPKLRRRRRIPWLLLLIALLAAGGFMIVNNSGVFTTINPTQTQPAILEATSTATLTPTQSATPTITSTLTATRTATRTPSPTEEPDTATPTPTRTASPTRMPPTKTQLPSATSRPPTTTATHLPPTNPPAPPTATSAPVSNPTQDSGGQQPPPSNGGGEPPPENNGPIEEIIEDVGDSLKDLTGGLLP